MLDLTTEVKSLYRTLKERKNFRCNRSLAIVGGNTEGKTSIIMSILTMAKQENDWRFYFLDPLNRSISQNKTTNACFEDFAASDILLERLNANSKKREDRFPKQEDGASVAYHELCENYEEKYKELLDKVFNIELKFSERSELIGDDPEIYVNPGNRLISDLSSSEMAKIRMLMEIDYAVNRCECEVIVIDEFDAYLDKTNIAEFLNILITNYPQATFVVVMHNIECIVLMEDIDVLLLTNNMKKEDDYSTVCFKANDINEVSQIYKLQYRVNNSKVSEEENLIRDCIRDYLELGKKTDIAEQVGELKEKATSVRLKVLIDFWERVIQNGD